MTGNRTLLVASTGGHLDELTRLRHRLSPPADEADWVTFDDPQALSLLAGETVHYIPYIPPRGYAEVGRAIREATRLLRTGAYSRVVSTGSGIAIPYLTVARGLGLEAHYVESAARTAAPSRTGSVLSRIPGVRLYCQYPAWAGPRWKYRGSLFDGYHPEPRPGAPDRTKRVVVTLGTMRIYGFRSAVAALARLLPEVVADGADVLWQVGVTDTAGLPIEARSVVPTHELLAAVAEADLVVAHAGIGSTLFALDAGHCPVLLPRRAARGEHVDDHQVLIADALAAKGLAVVGDPATLTPDDLRAAVRTVVRRHQRPEPFLLS
jgi:UDP-N-acetylglucosamine--N-acetylmuramyl-(pentapeptide) pyrophosphoryl-undecaprenol N-acetylglucosamine transferase